MRISFGKWVGLMLGILFLGGLAVTAGAPESTTVPSANSYAPSGMRAFFELTQRLGYKARVDRSTRPVLHPGDVAICASVSGTSVNQSDEFDGHVTEKVSQGAGVLVLHMYTDFKVASSATTSKARDNLRNQDLEVSASPDDLGISWNPFGESGLQMVAVAGSNGALSTVGPIDKGRMAVIANGIAATNKFIGEVDNARYLIDHIAALVGESGTVVFCEAAIGISSEPGLLQTLGLWAQGMAWQVSLLFLVVAYSLGKRFGYAETSKFRQAGTHDLVDALASMYRRSKSAHVALRILYLKASRDLRKQLRLPRDATHADVASRVTPELARALAEAEVASEHQLPAADAIRVERALAAALRSFYDRKQG